MSFVSALPSIRLVKDQTGEQVLLPYFPRITNMMWSPYAPFLQGEPEMGWKVLRIYLMAFPLTILLPALAGGMMEGGLPDKLLMGWLVWFFCNIIFSLLHGWFYPGQILRHYLRKGYRLEKVGFKDVGALNEQIARWVKKQEDKL